MDRRVGTKAKAEDGGDQVSETESQEAMMASSVVGRNIVARGFGIGTSGLGRRVIVAAWLAVSMAHTIAAQSAWLPEPRRTAITMGYSLRRFDRAYAGAPLIDLPGFRQHIGTVTVEHGLGRRWAADLTFGYSSMTRRADGLAPNDRGFSDTHFGFRYQLTDERRSDRSWMPTVAVRTGGILAGTYTANQLWSAGDGQAGLETGLLFGKTFRQGRNGFFGDLVWRWRRTPVPMDAYGSIGAFHRLGGWTFASSFRGWQSFRGADFGDPGFQFPGLKEISRIVDGSVAYTTRRGITYQVFVGGVVTGRNTGRSTLVGVSTSFGF